ncbi:MAG: glycosyltransferase family 4 protein [Pseudomonadota bacterium]
MSKMKITFVVPMLSLHGGHRVIAIYAQKLRSFGHDVTIVTNKPEVATGLRRIKGVVTGRENPEAKRADSTYYRPIMDKLIELPKKGPIDPDLIPDADVIVATWWRTAFSVAALPQNKGKQFYFIQHHEVHDHLPWDISRGSYFLPLRKIVISDWLAEKMAGQYDDPNVVKIENSVDTDLFHAEPRERNTVPRVGFLYAKTHFKGVDITLRAIELARQKFPDLEVIAFGTEDPAAPLSLPKLAKFHKSPAQDQLRALYASCDVWLCGSRLEGFHLPPLEAMACRCPVVSTRVGGATEIVTEGVNGHIVDVEDAEALAQRLTQVLQKSPTEWRAMSDAAHARAISYSWDDAARKLESELETALGDT